VIVVPTLILPSVCLVTVDGPATSECDLLGSTGMINCAAVMMWGRASEKSTWKSGRIEPGAMGAKPGSEGMTKDSDTGNPDYSR